MNKNLIQKILLLIIVGILFISIFVSGQEIISESAQGIKLESIQKVKNDINQEIVLNSAQDIVQDNNQENVQKSLQDTDKVIKEENAQVHSLELKSVQLDQLEKVYVDWIYDGDTFRLMDGRKIRLLGIDTAEMNWDDGDPEFYAREAFDYTKEILLYKYVYLQYDQEIKDNYGRTLAYVFLEDGTLFNLKLLQEGYASLLLIPPNFLYDEIFGEIAGQARTSLKGIWDRWGKISETLAQISPEEAGDYMGEEVIVEGFIDKSYDKETVLLFDIISNKRRSNQDNQDNNRDIDIDNKESNKDIDIDNKESNKDIEKDNKESNKDKVQGSDGGHSGNESTQEADASLQVVIFEDDFKKFDYDPINYLIDRRIKVSGQVEEYKGQIEIIVNGPLQIMILDEDES